MNYKLNDVVNFYMVRSGTIATEVVKKILKNITVINVPIYFVDKMVDIYWKIPHSKVWKAGSNPFKANKDRKMEIKKNLKISTTDFWYDLTDGGYLDPYKICANQNDAEDVAEAIALLREFRESCEDKIKDFIQ